MLTAYIQAAMKKAHYEFLEDGTFFGSIPGFEGLCANEVSLEACRDLLQEVLEEWLLLSFAKQLPIPVVDGLDLKIATEVA